jgi:membrane-bound lytic murein transglycosylase B
LCPKSGSSAFAAGRRGATRRRGSGLSIKEHVDFGAAREAFRDVVVSWPACVLSRFCYTDFVVARVAVASLVSLITVAGVRTIIAQTPAPQDQPRPSFTEWLAAVRSEAVARGFREDIVDRALGTVEEPQAVVLERDRSQAETVLPLETYLSRRVTAANIRTGRQMLIRHGTLLKQISGKYGVPEPVIVAIWGAESNFGRFSGVRPTVPALATLAFDQRRSTLFRRELFSALEILDRGHIELDAMRGSWAGAMGQPQFMPSSYLQYAEDFDGDGRRNIWNSPSDIFASIANYLKGYGWSEGRRWGREVTVSKAAASQIAADVAPRAGSCQAKRNMTVALPLEEWQRLGIRRANGRDLPVADQKASMVSGSSRHFLVYENYDVLLDYNCAHAYALGVALLSDRLTSAQ